MTVRRPARRGGGAAVTTCPRIGCPRTRAVLPAVMRPAAELRGPGRSPGTRDRGTRSERRGEGAALTARRRSDPPTRWTQPYPLSAFPVTLGRLCKAVSLFCSNAAQRAEC
ncbi:uncharacterized protein LOC101676715 isoform X2 [Mustela putorius furo]|uniref:Uncharacterized protein LOC101676715 isoform X2 n=1 Tax=Mustela putorius furo TaxID=9669 RepID=A0A8U0SCT2_MUSPF|nr:uncharacterized protein LOC101676715 isoform X2 [Mustela putorius furo]